MVTQRQSVTMPPTLRRPGATGESHGHATTKRDHATRFKPTGCHWRLARQCDGQRLPDRVQLANHRVTQQQSVTMPPALSQPGATGGLSASARDNDYRPGVFREANNGRAVRPNGATECSRGWSGEAALRPDAQPVENEKPPSPAFSFFKPRRGERGAAGPSPLFRLCSKYPHGIVCREQSRAAALGERYDRPTALWPRLDP
jgi:hypothetical protein